MTDVMVDIETSSTDPAHGGILQIAAVKFNYNTEKIGDVFDRCLMMAPRRYWSEDTRTWWLGQSRTIYNNIVARMEPPEQVLRDLGAFATGNLRMWAKPISFDYGFIQSYYNQYDLPMPFHYRHARDLNTHIAALAGGADHVSMDHIQTDGAHNALADCVHQLKMLFAAKRRDFGPVDAIFEELE